MKRRKPMRNYSDSPENFKLAHASDWSGISVRNIGILAMWMTGLGIPEPYQEFVIAVLVSGNWEETDEEEITLKRMARAISPGTDSDQSIKRAYERLKKSSIQYFKWQETQTFAPIPKEVSGKGRYTRARYKFPHYKLLADLFDLPKHLPQKQIRAEVSKALGNLALPPPKPRK